MTLSLKGLNRFIEFGISAETSAESRRSIRLVNILNIITGGSAIILGPLLTQITGKPIMVPGLFEAACFGVSIFLNTKKKYFAAAMLMLFTQNLAAVYFGILLGQGISIKMLACGLAITAAFLFHTTRSRMIGLVFGFVPIILLNINEVRHIITPWSFTPDEHELIKWLADVVIYLICAVIVLTFVKQNQRASANKTLVLRESSHEINKWLHPILVTLEKYLKKPVVGHLVPLEFKDLQTIDIAARGIFETVKDGLNFTQIEAGKIDKYNPEPFNIVNFLNEIKISYHSLSMKKDVRIKVDTPSDIPEWIITDKYKLKVIVSNILSNAINFSHINSSVYINVRFAGGLMTFEIVDHGKGMNQTRQATIFDGLFVSEKNDLVEGYGAGMVMTRRMVTFLGGKISVKSKEEVGTTFTVSLPVEVPNPAAVDKYKSPLSTTAEETASDLGLNLSDKCILIIDDDTMTQEAIAGMLNTFSCSNIYAASTAENGAALAKEIIPDLVFLDVQLPDANGFALLKKLKQLPDYKNIPIISLSSENSDIIRHEAKKAGAIIFMKKPINLEDFRKNMQNIFNVPV